MILTVYRGLDSYRPIERLSYNLAQELFDILINLSNKYALKYTKSDFLGLPDEEKAKVKKAQPLIAFSASPMRSEIADKVERNVIAIDIDDASNFDLSQLQYSYQYIAYETIKSTELLKRWRLIFLTDRCITTKKQYETASKSLVDKYLRNVIVDKCSFSSSQLFYIPVTFSDVSASMQLVNADRSLLELDSLLLAVPTYIKEHSTKTVSLIEVFNKRFTVVDVLDTILNDVFIREGNRYRYSHSKSNAGILVNEDNTLVSSFHESDALYGKTVDAFELIRTCKCLGNTARAMVMAKDLLDNGLHCSTTTHTVKTDMPIVNDKALSIDDSGISATISAMLKPKDETLSEYEILAKLEKSDKGKPLSTAYNIRTIFEKSELAGLVSYDRFSNRLFITRKAPWYADSNNNVDYPKPLDNTDIGGMRSWFSIKYGIVAKDTIADELSIAAKNNSINPLQDYINSLRWDGVPRLETCLCQFLAAEDCLITRLSTIKFFMQAVDRALNPGCKADMVLVLSGSQGIGKSTFFNKLAKSWFSDSFATFQGKVAMEQITGKWIVELAELSAMRKSEIELVKAFITRRSDYFRVPWGIVPEDFPRSCVFVGTTNETEFLQDHTGNRRFLPVRVGLQEQNVAEMFKPEFDVYVDSLWAEATYKLKNNLETTYLTPEETAIFEEAKSQFIDRDARIGLIMSYLDIQLPLSWYEKSLFDRLTYLSDYRVLGAKTNEPLYQRKYTNLLEIWVEALGCRVDTWNNRSSKEVRNLMAQVPGWHLISTPRNFKLYGMQRCYAHRSVFYNLGKHDIDEVHFRCFERCEANTSSKLLLNEGVKI